MEKLYVELIDIALDQLRKMDTANENEHFFTDGQEVYLYQERGTDPISINQTKRIYAKQIHKALSLTPNKIAIYICPDNGLVSYEKGETEEEDEPIHEIYGDKIDVLGTTLYYLYD